MLTKSEELFEGKLSLNIPGDFEKLRDEEISEFYKNEKPTIVYANKSKWSVLAITLLEQELEDKDIERRVQQYAALYKCSIPKFANCKIMKREINESKSICFFHYTSTIDERDFFNYIVLGNVDNKELLITMHCNLKDVPIYAEKFVKAINTIRL